MTLMPRISSVEPIKQIKQQNTHKSLNLFARLGCFGLPKTLEIQFLIFQLSLPESNHKSTTPIKTFFN